MTGETTTRSMTWQQRAAAVIPGGVNSPVRAFGAVGDDPVFAASGSGAYVHTVDGEDLFDFVASWGGLILGHAHPDVVASVIAAARRGTSFGLSTPAEVELAELICELVPSIDVVRMVNSGTEATASAVRLARAATGRPGIIMFEGCYHGHADAFLARAGSGLATFGEPSSPGVPQETTAATRIARYNDLTSVTALLDDSVAAVIVEPVAGNMGCIPPADGFLRGLREACDRSGALLIFDEVMTGFRVGLGGAQTRFEVTPDLTTLGKVVAGGTPGAAYGGGRDLMSQISPEGPVYQAGTLSGNPLVTAAGLTTLRHLAEHSDLYDRFEQAVKTASKQITESLDAAGIPGVVTGVGGMMGVFLGIDHAESWDDVADLDKDLFGQFFKAVLRRGVLLPPSPYESWFLTEAQLGEPFEGAINAICEAIKDVGR